MSGRRAIVTLPRQARRGEVIEIKTLAQHPMETGFRRTQDGDAIPRDIIRTFTCTYNGAEVFRAELHAAIAANPFLAFTTVATESGTLEFRWTGDKGFSVTETAGIAVV
jgi:sulfur-oxidizing protein SoxZ